ncbi:MAG: hypothetical protein IPI31_18585 [Bacteroidetes bacterium]|jgi:hypothetical protein|nr:hypothetical protein [Bacteroidota bacterium]MBK7569828.1 hypothetical protein [Bacteroidota bacterium]
MKKRKGNVFPYGEDKRWGPNLRGIKNNNQKIKNPSVDGQALIGSQPLKFC